MENALCGTPHSGNYKGYGYKFRCNDFWDRSGGQALLLIGGWYPRQPLTHLPIVSGVANFFDELAQKRLLRRLPVFLRL